MRRTPTFCGLVLATALALGGCTVSGGEASPEPSGVASGRTTGSADSTPDAAPSPSGPSVDELSADVLALAGADLGAPLGGQTIEVLDNGNQPVQVTVDVLELRRTRDATLLRLTMSSPSEVGTLQVGTFSAPGTSAREFFDRISLEDGGAGTRHHPLSWRRTEGNEAAPVEGPLDSCVCPFRGQSFTLTPEPLVMDVLYGPLPEGVQSVAVVSPDGLRIPDVALQPAG